MEMSRVRRVNHMVSSFMREGFVGTVPEVSGDLREEGEAVKWSLQKFLARYRTALDEHRETGAALFPLARDECGSVFASDVHSYCESG